MTSVSSGQCSVRIDPKSSGFDMPRQKPKIIRYLSGLNFYSRSRDVSRTNIGSEAVKYEGNLKLRGDIKFTRNAAKQPKYLQNC